MIRCDDMRNDLRDVYFYDLELKPSKEGAVAPPMSEVVNVLLRKFDAKEATYQINHDTESLTIRDIQIDEQNCVAVLLITHADPSAPNAVYAKPDDGTSRVIRKEPGEAGEFGAHVVVSLQEEAQRPNSYLALVERVQSVGRAHVERLLNGLINAQYKANENTFVCEDQSGKRTRTGEAKMIGFRPIVHFSGHPSENFVRDLEAGVLSGLTMVKATEQAPFGRRRYLTKKEMSLKVNVNKDNIVANLWDDLKDALSIESDAWSEARISFSKDDGRSVQVCVDTATGNIRDDTYVKTVRFCNIDPFLDNSSNIIVKHFSERMVAELLDQRANGA